jgi:hypothetical protein|tara:strand:- start:1162 stop:1602 length:441 start_codon:yes stop_codon:yes gene_type:complete
MNTSTKKPYVIYIAEVIYSYISIIKKNNSSMSTKEAINEFIKSDEFNKLSSGTLHNQWFNELKKNNYKDKETGENIPKETLELLKIQRDATIKQLIKVPVLYETENDNLIKVSNRAFEFLWRMCESYELWINETGQSEYLLLKIID